MFSQTSYYILHYYYITLISFYYILHYYYITPVVFYYRFVFYYITFITDYYTLLFYYITPLLQTVFVFLFPLETLLSLFISCANGSVRLFGLLGVFCSVCCVH